MDKRPQDTERQVIAELGVLEKLPLDQLIVVASSEGSAGRRVLAETLRSLDTPAAYRKHTGPKK